MGETDTTTNKNHIGVFAPFRLLKRERIYWFWSVALIISYLGIFINLMNGNNEACFSSGAFYSTGITIS